MAEFKSESLSINKAAKEVFGFLNDFNNFEKLMPEQVTNWKSTHNTCSFTIQGMADISMKIEGSIPNEKVHMKSTEAPFDFDMTSLLEAKAADQCIASIELKANINPMMLMMVKRPLQNLVNIMVEKLKEEMEK